MAQNKINKLELTWIDKEDVPLAIEPRLLLETPEYSFGEVETGILPNGKPWPGNMLIHGDNLLALRALEVNFKGAIKCIYIDPPYNTGAAFEHYDDNLEHSIWLRLMHKRLEILCNLLSEDGAICVQIDATEMAYLKVVMDEIFGRSNFINMISVKTKIAGVSGSNLGKSLQDNVEYILLYAKNIQSFLLNIVPVKKQELYSYIQSYVSDGKSWKYTSVLRSIDDGTYIKSFKAGNGDEIKLFKHEKFEICSINQIANEEFGGDVKKSYYHYIDRVFRTTNAQTSIRTKVIEETAEFNSLGLFSIEYTPIKGRNAGRVIRSFYKDDNLIAWLKDVVTITPDAIYKVDNMGNLWDDIQYNNLTKEGSVQFPNGKKPEALVARIVEMLSCENEVVLDSFLGSGTTAAVAHKLNRRWIGVELGEHAYTHSKVRLECVISGSDKGGITLSSNWQGGGGFKFYELAPSLLNKDKYGNLVINKDYNADMLAAAMAKHQGFTFSPDAELYWKQGHSSEHDFIFTTTQLITAEMLDAIHDQLGEDESLLICCTKFQPECRNKFSNITIKKIPKVLLDTCEFDHDDYSLNIVSVPEVADEEWEDLETEDDFEASDELND